MADKDTMIKNIMDLGGTQIGTYLGKLALLDSASIALGKNLLGDTLKAFLDEVTKTKSGPGRSKVKFRLYKAGHLSQPFDMTPARDKIHHRLDEEFKDSNAVMYDEFTRHAVTVNDLHENQCVLVTDAVGNLPAYSILDAIALLPKKPIKPRFSDPIGWVTRSEEEARISACFADNVQYANRNSVKPNLYNYLLITGQSGSGKTALGEHVEDFVNLPNVKVIHIPVQIGSFRALQLATPTHQKNGKPVRIEEDIELVLAGFSACVAASYFLNSIDGNDVEDLAALAFDSANLQKVGEAIRSHSKVPETHTLLLAVQLDEFQQYLYPTLCLLRGLESLIRGQKFTQRVCVVPLLTGTNLSDPSKADATEYHPISVKLRGLTDAQTGSLIDHAAWYFFSKASSCSSSSCSSNLLSSSSSSSNPSCSSTSSSSNPSSCLSSSSCSSSSSSNPSSSSSCSSNLLSSSSSSSNPSSSSSNPSSCSPSSSCSNLLSSSSSSSNPSSCSSSPSSTGPYFSNPSFIPPSARYKNSLFWYKSLIRMLGGLPMFAYFLADLLPPSAEITVVAANKIVHSLMDKIERLYTADKWNEVLRGKNAGEMLFLAVLIRRTMTFEDHIGDKPLQFFYDRGLISLKQVPNGYHVELPFILLQVIHKALQMNVIPPRLQEYFHQIDEDNFPDFIASIHLLTYRLLASTSQALTTTATVREIYHGYLQSASTLGENGVCISKNAQIVSAPCFTVKKKGMGEQGNTPYTMSKTEKTRVLVTNVDRQMYVDVTKGEYLVLGPKRGHSADGLYPHGWEQYKYSSTLASNLYTFNEKQQIDKKLVKEECKKSGVPLIFVSPKPLAADVDPEAYKDIGFLCGSKFIDFVSPFAPPESFGTGTVVPPAEKKARKKEEKTTSMK